MFRWLNKQGVESDKGFIVQVVSRFVIEYRQHLKKISVHIEVESASSSKVTIIVHKSSFTHWDDAIHITENEQAKIIKNFIDAMKFQDIDVILED
jgi:hypothetical protein